MPPPDGPPPPPPPMSCAGQTEPVLTMDSSPLTGNTSGANADKYVFCGNVTSIVSDLELQLKLPDLLTFRAYSDGGLFIDAAMDLGRCGGGSIGWGGCDYSAAGDNAELEYNHVPAGNYYLLVANSPVDPSEPFTVTVNGMIQPNGRCDVPLATSGALVCAPGTSCNGTSCVSASGECGDGIDNDGDGKNGYPFDPGCSSITDPTEADDCPLGAGCAACASPYDEDGDGFAGYPTDPGCKSPGDLDESDECATNPLACPACSNGYDDDDDGDDDEDDSACSSAAWTSEYPES